MTEDGMKTSCWSFITAAMSTGPPLSIRSAMRETRSSDEKKNPTGTAVRAGLLLAETR